MFRSANNLNRPIEVKLVNTKTAYTTPVVLVHGKMAKLTLGSNIAIEDAWIGVDGNDGIIGPECEQRYDKYEDKWWYACGS